MSSAVAVASSSTIIFDVNKSGIRANFYASSQVRCLKSNSLFKGFSRQSSKLSASRSFVCSAAANEVSDNNVASDNSYPKDTEEDLDMSESSAFLADVANLVRLVDSRDVVELELKHKDFEILIKKHDTKPQPPQARYPGPHVLAHTAYPDYVLPQMAPASAPAPAASSESAHAVAAPPPPPPAASGSPPMASPMSGTFYRSPAPGEPAFVKVGDTVNKGQVVCIIEAMKLMNEIEADRNGTIIDILVTDGKSVGIGTPLYSIK